LRLHLAGNGGAPRREDARHFELDRRVFDALHVADLLRALNAPSARPAAEHRLQRFPLRGIALRVDEYAHRGLGVLPDVALERADRQHVVRVEEHVAIAPMVYVPREKPFAVAERGGLRKLAGAGDVALADVEPVAFDAPAGNASPGLSFQGRMTSGNSMPGRDVRKGRRLAG